jgi:hypothetical protein
MSDLWLRSKSTRVDRHTHVPKSIVARNQNDYFKIQHEARSGDAQITLSSCLHVIPERPATGNNTNTKILILRSNLVDSDTSIKQRAVRRSLRSCQLLRAVKKWIEPNYYHLNFHA